MAAHNELGKRGEKVARQYLEDEGYTILKQNWRYGRAEVDLIGSKDGTLVFAEVKTRSAGMLEHYDDLITPTKIQQLDFAAEEYIERTNHNGEVRFDVIAILFKNNKDYTLTHIDDAFWPY